MTIVNEVANVERILQTSATTFWDVSSEIVGQIIAGVFVLFLIYKAIRITMGTEGFNYVALTAQIGWTGFVVAMLTFPSVWFGIVSFFLSAGPALASTIFSALGGPVEPNDNGLSGYILIIFQTFDASLLEPLSAILGDISLFSKFTLVLGVLVLTVVYVYYIYLLIKGVLTAYFWIYGIGLLGAFILGFAAFEETRSIFWDAIRIMLTNTLQLLLGSAGLAITLSLAAEIFEQAKASNIDSLTNVYSGGFLTTVFVGVMSILLFNAVVSIPGYLFKTFIDGRQSGPVGDVIGLVKQATGLAR
jgi:hypothetical protein